MAASHQQTPRPRESSTRVYSLNNRPMNGGRQSSGHIHAASFKRFHSKWSHRKIWHTSKLQNGEARSGELARQSRLEAILFLAREPLSLRKLSQLANLADATEARTLLKNLQRQYDERQCAFQIAQIAGGYQLLSRREFASWLRPQSANEREVRLSPPALETLVVVAYRQPILRAEVEAIRGVACGEILRQLLDRDLVRIAGRSEELGRPLRYGTTRRFLEVFGLARIDELPWSTELRRSATNDA